MKHLYLTLCTILFSFACYAVAPITGADTVCAGSTVTLSDATPGGVWSSSSTAIATIGSSSGICTGVSAGTVVINYTVGATTVLFLMSVNFTPDPITGTATLCPSTSVTMLDPFPSGTWSSSNTAVGVIDLHTGLVNGISGGTATITYALTNGCFVTTPLTVNPLPSPITGPSFLCLPSVVSLSDPTAGGTWSSSNTGIATISSAGSVSGISPGTDTIVYTLSTGCITLKAITVNTSPSAIAGVGSVCLISSSTLSDAISGGSWTSSNPSIASIDSVTGYIVGLTAGSSIITYALATGCFATTTFTVNPLPTPISGSTYGCTSLTTTLSDATAGGVWTSGNTTIATISAGGVLSGVTAGVDTITYTLSATGCFMAVSVNIYTPPAPAVVTTVLDSICPDKFTYLVTDVKGGAWTHANSCTGLVAGYVHGLIPGIDTIFYTITTVCGTAVTPFEVTVRTPESCAIGHENITQPATATALHIYPNPATGNCTVTVSSATAAKVTMTITDVTGRKLREFTHSTNQPLDLQLDVPKGIYFLSVTTPAGKTTEKIIVQ